MIEIGKHYKVNELVQLVEAKAEAVLSSDSIEKIESCYRYLHNKIDRSQEPIYGINTGFGSLCNTEISEHDLELLQRNLVMSHACGMGEEVPQDIVKLMLLLKIKKWTPLI